jgi:hypothetical protein
MIDIRIKPTNSLILSALIVSLGASAAFAEPALPRARVTPLAAAVSAPPSPTIAPPQGRRGRSRRRRSSAASAAAEATPQPPPAAAVAPNPAPSITPPPLVASSNTSLGPSSPRAEEPLFSLPVILGLFALTLAALIATIISLTKQLRKTEDPS